MRAFARQLCFLVAPVNSDGLVQSAAAWMAFTILSHMSAMRWFFCAFATATLGAHTMWRYRRSR